MRKIQQTQDTIDINTDSLSIETELNNFIEMAIKNGYTLEEAVRYVKKFIKDNWVDHLKLPEENETERIFREKAKKFLDANYEKFDSWCDGRFNNYCWSKIESENRQELKKRFIYDVAGSMYKGFEMETLDKKELKKYALERVKKLVPEIEKGYALCFDVTLAMLLDYAQNYDCPKECDTFLREFEFLRSYDRSLCKFVWMVENL